MNKQDCVPEVVPQVKRPLNVFLVTANFRLERRGLYSARLQTETLRITWLLRRSERMRLSWSSSKGIFEQRLSWAKDDFSTKTKTATSDATLFARMDSKAPSFQWRFWPPRSQSAGQSESTHTRRARRAVTVTNKAHKQIACTNSRIYIDRKVLQIY